MNIQIDDKYSLQTDQEQYILQERKEAGQTAKEPGKEYIVNIGYYMRLQAALNAYLERKVRGSKAETITELLDDVHKARETIEEFCHEVIGKHKVIDKELSK